MGFDIQRYEDEQALSQYNYRKYLAQHGGALPANAQYEKMVVQETFEIADQIVTGLEKMEEHADFVIAQRPGMEFEVNDIKSVVVVGLRARLARFIREA